MQLPIRYRKGIPFFYDKPALAFSNDPYEQYRAMVVRQTALHLADELWGAYPFAALMNWCKAQLIEAPETIVDLGCGVGRLIGELALDHPKADCWGIDYSYQMLKRANEYWVKNKIIELDWRERGFPVLKLKGKKCQNLQFGLSKAESLPFEAASIDCVVSFFLFDRLAAPTKMLAEVWRVLKSGGKLLLITPFNFQSIKNWNLFYPISKLEKVLLQAGYEIKNIKEQTVKEPLDTRGNFIIWQCWMIDLRKM